MLCKRSGKYIDIYFILKITYLKLFAVRISRKTRETVCDILIQWGVWETSFSPDGSGDNVPNW